MSKQRKVQSDIVEQKNVSQKKKDLKTTLRNLLVLVLVASVSVVGTLAFLGDNSEKKVNTFTGSAGIDVTLTEDQWTSVDNDNTVQGEEMAQSYTPKMVIPKNPTLTNSSNAECDEWVALRVDYKYDGTATTRADLEATVIETLEIDAAKWFKLPTQANSSDTQYDIYLYKTPLSKGSTATLFNQVIIKDQATLAANNVYNNTSGKYKNFEITLYGAAIKNDDSLQEGLTSIVTGDIATSIDMNNLGNAVSASSKDSQKIAVALAELLKTVPTT